MNRDSRSAFTTVAVDSGTGREQESEEKTGTTPPCVIASRHAVSGRMYPRFRGRVRNRLLNLAGILSMH